MFEIKETDFLIYNVFFNYMLLLFVLFFRVASSYSLRISHFQTEGLPLPFFFFNIYSYFQASWLAVNSVLFFRDIFIACSFGKDRFVVPIEQ